MKNINTSTTSNTRSFDDYSINTSNAILEVLHALNLYRGDVTDEQLAALDTVLTGFAIDSIETAGEGI